MSALRGVTWQHTRGFAPLAAAGQVFNDRHPETTITWDVRSLWSFGEEDLDGFARDYDLVVWDYPFAGAVAASGCFRPLDELLGDCQIAAFAQSFVGPAYRGFAAGGRQWALPIDAACQVAAARLDLFESRGLALPRNWDDVVSLARAGHVAMSLRPMGIWASLLSLCGAGGAVPFAGPDLPVERDAGLAALHQLAAIVPHLDRACFGVFPTALFSRMTSEDTVAYVPLAYGYSAYAMDAYAPKPVTFVPPVSSGSDFRGATYGGAGLSVSRHSAHPEQAARFMVWVAGDDAQAGVVPQCFGQPAARKAWDSAAVNTQCRSFYANTRAMIEGAFARPTVPAFHTFQSACGAMLHAAFQEDVIDCEAVFERWTDLYRRLLAPDLFG